MLPSIQSNYQIGNLQDNARNSSTTSTARDSDLGTDFQTFLTLLTTQLRNQDPLKPLDSTQFVAQLASFSSVEQQVKTNDRLAEIISLLSDVPK